MKAMRRERLVTLLLAAAACGSAHAQVSPELKLLGRIRKHMAESLKRAPDYTCVEMMERSIWRTAAQKLLFRERLRLEVAFIGGRELFAWPETGRFEARPLAEFVAGGSIGNGSFAVHAWNVFRSSSPVITYAGEDLLNGKRTHRFDYHVSLLASSSVLNAGGKEAKVPHHGSFWVDAETLDLLRLENHADDIPPELDCSVAGDIIEYAREPLGPGDFLVPRSAELIIANRAGIESRNVIRFSQCRQYTSESSISFEQTAPDAAARAKPAAELRLPAGIELAMKLETPIRFETATVGDPIEARLSKGVKAGDLVLPKDTLIAGRIRRLEQRFDPDFFVVGFEFFAANPGDRRVVFSARLIGPRRNAPSAQQWVDGRMVRLLPEGGGLDIDDTEMRPGIGAFRVRGDRLRLSRGFRMMWETR